MKTGPTPDDDHDDGGDDDVDDDGGGGDDDDGGGDDDVMQEETYRVQKAWGEPSLPPRQPSHLCSLILVGCQPAGGSKTTKQRKTFECQQVNQDKEENLSAPNHGATQHNHSEKGKF